MNAGRTVFAQLIAHLSHIEFQKCVARYDGDDHLRSLSCWDQYLAMAFAQFTYRESLRDIEACLRSMSGKLYHMGFRSRIARSTLADANETHDWRIFADFAQHLIGVARPLHAEDPMGVDLDHSLYALDSTTIDLSLALFPWAKFRKHKGAVKMHTLLDLHGNIPTFISITDGKVHDVNILDEILPEAGAFYVMDRGYIDFARLYEFTLSSAFFVVRTKGNAVLQRRYSRPVDKSLGLRSDHTVVLTVIASATAYPDALRRVSYFDAETNQRLGLAILAIFSVAELRTAYLLNNPDVKLRESSTLMRAFAIFNLMLFGCAAFISRHRHMTGLDLVHFAQDSLKRCREKFHALEKQLSVEKQLRESLRVASETDAHRVTDQHLEMSKLYLMYNRRVRKMEDADGLLCPPFLKGDGASVSSLVSLPKHFGERIKDESAVPSEDRSQGTLPANQTEPHIADGGEAAEESGLSFDGPQPVPDQNGKSQAAGGTQ